MDVKFDFQKFYYLSSKFNLEYFLTPCAVRFDLSCIRAKSNATQYPVLFKQGGAFPIQPLQLLSLDPIARRRQVQHQLYENAVSQVIE